MKRLVPTLLCIALAACSTAPKKSSPAAGHSGKPAHPGSVASTRPGAGDHDCSRYAPAQEDLSTRGDYVAGGLYRPGVSDSTPDHVPDLDCIAEPTVVDEAYSSIGNRSPYKVLGRSYKVLDSAKGYVERGTASYYGNKFHGRLTSNREVYDMYAYTAAHKTLPLPSFARVTNLDNGKSVVVRVNDRGPFHDGRVIDLSYAAAVKLGITARGTGNVEVRGLTAKEAAAQPVLAKAETKPAEKTSDMDRLVTRLPAETKPVSNAALATEVPSAPDDGYRYRVVPDASRPASADRFDAWLKSRGLQEVGGKIVPVAEATTVAASDTKSVASATKVDSTPAPTPTPAERVASSSQPMVSAAGQVWLQVGSFASRDNAERALARLTAANVAGARLSDVESNGRTLWRLRVGAPDAASADALAGRIANLGFGQPQRVRE
ncbi:septal ring lytic transglycosylase RlpA family protein [Pseudoxanthomonas helianthi]|uniref:Endolytic peptidoglycan transglycosylase RlpA n=1 Tax=Pseudoxanthomonas helianthi TaxID=1453541 RepID=A0A941AVT7_9GAMM|nr:septal ring lytic transglycosylase RlpA family protein [Pseudoxanthomonas helianthi]MBP3984243.1 septal ring lytic transglycosylase RlpA family protein [Pseudoxanthomonas helianthi]